MKILIAPLSEEAESYREHMIKHRITAGTIKDYTPVI